MRGGPDHRPFARLLVAVDVRSSRASSVRATVSLAARLGADLEALFVEDIELLRAAGLPSAAELSLPGGGVRPVDRRAVEAQLAAMAATAREAVGRAADAQRVAWRFRVARGRVSDELLAAAHDADLVVLGRRPRRVVRVEVAGAQTARTVARRARTSVLVLPASGTTGRRAMVVFDASPPAQRALDVGVHLVEPGTRLTVLVAAATPQEAHRLAERARAGVPQGLGADVRWLGGSGAGHAVRAAGSSDIVLVVAGQSPLVEGNGLDALLDDGDSAVLLAR